MWHGHVVLLAGGIASRMQPLSQYIPKSLLPLKELFCFKMLLWIRARSVYSSIRVLPPREGSAKFSPRKIPRHFYTLAMEGSLKCPQKQKSLLLPAGSTPKSPQTKRAFWF